MDVDPFVRRGFIAIAQTKIAKFVNRRRSDDFWHEMVSRHLIGKNWLTIQIYCKLRFG